MALFYSGEMVTFAPQKQPMFFMAANGFCCPAPGSAVHLPGQGITKTGMFKDLVRKI